MVRTAIQAPNSQVGPAQPQETSSLLTKLIFLFTYTDHKNVSLLYIVTRRFIFYIENIESADKIFYLAVAVNTFAVGLELT